MDQSRYRIEEDLLGRVKLPLEVHYGIQTHRAVENFPRGRQQTIGDYPHLVIGLLKVKQAAAMANHRCGFLSADQCDAIVKAADDVLEKSLFRDFPIHRLHGGGGTSANMNANEVLAHIGNQRLKSSSGQTGLHPNEHVNLHQSTNDVYPTACHIAAILEWRNLDQIVTDLIVTLQEKARSLAGVVKISRTCLQDAVPISFNDFLSGYWTFLKRCRENLSAAVTRLYQVNLGGTIVGKESDVPHSYFQAIIPALRETTGDGAFSRSVNLFDAAQNPDDLVAVAASLDLFARGLIKIAKDIRLLNSGPEAGLNELRIPAVQPGSSAMPGKVNPVIPEFVIQSCFEVVGKCHAVGMAVDHGELDLNVWESVMVFNILDSMELLGHALDAFTHRCIAGLEVNPDVNRSNCQTTIAILTELARVHGYGRVNAICKEALETGIDINILLHREKMTT